MTDRAPRLIAPSSTAPGSTAPLRPFTALAVLGWTVAIAASAGSAALAGAIALDTVRGSSKVPWLLGRASGLTAYLLLVALVTTGLLLAHPWSRRSRRPTPATWLGLHVALATFTFAFLVLHVVVLATDPWAGVGWPGALLPLASTYRPVPVPLGVLALWAGLITGLTARLAGRFAARVWWPVHKGSILVLVLVWAHSVLAGSDVQLLRWFYLASGCAVLALAVTRYGARTPADALIGLPR